MTWTDAVTDRDSQLGSWETSDIFDTAVTALMAEGISFADAVDMTVDSMTVQGRKL